MSDLTNYFQSLGAQQERIWKRQKEEMVDAAAKTVNVFLAILSLIIIISLCFALAGSVFEKLIDQYRNLYNYFENSLSLFFSPNFLEIVFTILIIVNILTMIILYLMSWDKKEIFTTTFWGLIFVVSFGLLSIWFTKLNFVIILALSNFIGGLFDSTANSAMITVLFFLSVLITSLFFSITIKNGRSLAIFFWLTAVGLFFSPFISLILGFYIAFNS